MVYMAEKLAEELGIFISPDRLPPPVKREIASRGGLSLDNDGRLTETRLPSGPQRVRLPETTPFVSIEKQQNLSGYDGRLAKRRACLAARLFVTNISQLFPAEYTLKTYTTLDQRV